MNENPLILLAILSSSLLCGVIIFFLREEDKRIRTALNLFGAVLKVLLVGWVLIGFFQGESYHLRYTITVDLEFHFQVDGLALLFCALSSVLWLVTTLYAIGYLEGSPNRRRFFGFFSLCVTASTGIALAGNLVTFFIFYEFLTLATYPLIVHKGSEEALRAGRTYLWYTIGGGTVLFVGLVGLIVLTGSADFGDTAEITAVADQSSPLLFILFVVLTAGLGVKAALVPLHGWLPVSMVAPAPVSALLHAVAVVKAGVFGLIRLIYDVYGLELCIALGVLPPLAALAAFTIIYGSLRALAQDDLKKRLAYSTVSQLSYITLGAAIPGVIATTGALAHLVHQGVMKITLFFCAGIIAETLGIVRISQMAGVGKRLPLTMTAFSIGAMGMIGLPPIAGFISKWYLGLGGLSVEQGWVIAVLLASSLLNAAYFLPILHIAWFQSRDEPFPLDHSSGRWETSLLLLLPAVFTAAAALFLGLFAAGSWSVLELASTIAERWYAR